MNELKDNPAGDPSWRTLLQAALHRNRSDAGVRYLQLATVDPWGHPRNRTVVFRGFFGGYRPHSVGGGQPQREDLPDRPLPTGPDLLVLL